MSSIVALIPARSGSKRIPNKNIKRLGKHPLLAYTIEQARQSGIFSNIIVSTDSEEYANITRYYEAYPLLRPPLFSKDTSPDYEWIIYTLGQLSLIGKQYDLFMILRPTNPFRTPKMIKQAMAKYTGSWMKAVEPVSQHPEKMWEDVYDERVDIYHTHLKPILKTANHQFPTQILSKIYIQNGSLEIRPTNDIEPNQIHGYFTTDYLGYDLNTEKDWIYAEWLIKHGKVKLIDIDKEPYESSV